MKSQRAWIGAAVIAGIAYILIGRFFPNPATNSRPWRLGAWAASGLVFVWQIWFEHFARKSSARELAAHVATGVAIGGFGLAFIAMILSLREGPLRPIWLISLVAWPALTALPAYVAAAAIGFVLGRIRPQSSLVASER